MDKPPPPTGPFHPDEVPEMLGEEVTGPGKTYFDDVLLDNILDALLELSASVWAYRDRVIVLETVLAERGIEVSEAIEAHLPNATELQYRAEARDKFVQRVFGSFVRRSGMAIAPPPAKE